MLILGYSCLDKAPLDLIAKSNNVIKSLVIVNGDEPGGHAALAELQQHLGSAAPLEGRDVVEVFPGGFSDFDESGGVQVLAGRVLAAE